MRINKIENGYNKSINFHAGLTKNMIHEVSSCSPEKISKELAKNGIFSDFKNNKIIAWCCLKCFEIIKFLNQKYNLNLSLPNAIKVENFENLNADVSFLGFYNMVSTKDLYIHEDIFVDENTIFFNERPAIMLDTGMFEWENIDLIQDELKEKNQSPTNFFLDIFLHEFSHGIHFGNLLKKYSGKELYKKIIKINDVLSKIKFQSDYASLLRKEISEYAASNQIEAVACDMSRRISDSLNKITLLPESNFIETSPYKKLLTAEEVADFMSKSSETDLALRAFWNGHFFV